jgi:hypothetical protein
MDHLEDIVIDHDFYNKNYNLFFPSKKTLLTLEYEHCGYDMVALAPKNYYITEQTMDDRLAHFDPKKVTVKQKGVTIDENRNTHINRDVFMDCLQNDNIYGAENVILRSKDQKMTKQIMRKTGISGTMTKMVVLPNEHCCPFIYGVPASNYHTNDPRIPEPKKETRGRPPKEYDSIEELIDDMCKRKTKVKS